ncbi:MAG: enoyl-CoA hydratase [Pelagibacterales bacterium]|nr:enoyl-CoA hydratase [Pelagibacterales bacterium]PPR15724.1 MAG: Short-chain-enoyl-CoA hydratase [Alphaproteobacteria bacterium MarineAlpha9_Bin3]|tara:strand:- start:2883 stop:3716 length:834 start_codon:yes stop_codon:yes gene_type:complete
MNIDKTPLAPKPDADPEKGRITSNLVNDIFYIGIDRPTKLNGFTPEMFKQIAEAYTEYENNMEARCALVFSHGPHFTAGIDLPKIAPYMKSGNREYLHPKNLIDPLGLRGLIRSKPVVCAVRGITFTYGVELSLACDVTIAANNCRFSQLEVLRGIMPTGGATIRFVQRAGWGNAMKYLLSGTEFNSEEALKMNIVQEVVEPNKVFNRAKEIAKSISAAAPLAVKETIKSAKLALENGREAAVAEFDSVQEMLSSSNDAKEGVEAFKNKKTPIFKGN